MGAATGRPRGGGAALLAAALLAACGGATPPAAGDPGPPAPAPQPEPWSIAWQGRTLLEGAVLGGRFVGPWRGAWTGGGRESEGAYEAGRREGPWRFLHPDGGAKAEGRYAAGQPEGPWRFHGAGGELLGEVVFREGVATPPLADLPGVRPDACRPAEVKARMYAVGHDFRTCWEQGRAARPGLEGKLVVDFTIGWDGRVTGVQTARDELGSPETERCVHHVVRALPFPAPDLPAPCTIRWPFVFREPAAP